MITNNVLQDGLACAAAFHQACHGEGQIGIEATALLFLDWILNNGTETGVVYAIAKDEDKSMEMVRSAMHLIGFIFHEGVAEALEHADAAYTFARHVSLAKKRMEEQKVAS